jgi:hypothetical protein
MADARRCIGTNRDGGPCSAMPRAGREHCQWHDPELAEARAQWKVAGGKAKSNSARARRKVLAAGLHLHEVDAALCGALLDVLAGKIEPGVATAAATVARSIVAVRQAGEMEDRLAALEAASGLTKGQIA